MKYFHVFVIVMAVIFSQYAQAKKVYCTDTNWDKGQNLYKKAEDRYNKNIAEFNELLDDYNSFDFVHRMLTESTSDGDLYDQLQDHKDIAMMNHDALEAIRIDLKSTKKTTTKSKNLFEKLAEYCYDEDQYENYKSLRDNMRASIDLNTSIEKLTAKIKRFQNAYSREVSTIQKLTLIEQRKGSELTCSEAWDKVNHIEIVDNRFSFFQNFLESEHHSNRDHSLNIRQPNIATSDYYDAETPEEAEYIGVKIDALHQLISGASKINQGEHDYLYMNSHTEVDILQDWYRQNQDALPIEINGDTLSGAVKISPLQATAIKAVAIESLNSSLEKRKQFRVIMDRDNEQNKRVYFSFNEPCDVGLNASNQQTIVNGQSLSFSYLCLEQNPSQATYLYAIPDTDEDMAKLVASFKKKLWVEIELLGITRDFPVKFWAIGFTRAWNAL